MGNSNRPMPRGKARDWWWPWGFLGIIAVALCLVFLPAVLFLSPPASPPPRSAASIGVQPTDLGSGWSLSSTTTMNQQRGLVEYAGREFSRTSAYGGTVSVSSSVEIFNTTANASRRFEDVDFNASLKAVGTGVDVGDHGVLYETAAQVSVLFVRDRTVVYVSAYGYGSWQDLSGRAFSTRYRMAEDLLVLAGIVDSRIY